ncbi:P-loop containing nucleoside triphosphate hydrolase protein [Sporodiniella umbellata]|nr:P-loop containing nucleoside triphosphate hydrolase protein [Sporodiniella umbellata]
MSTASSVRVAVRVRPLTEQERQQQMSITFPSDNQIIAGGDRPFTFDYVYPPNSGQEDVFDSCVIPLLNKFLEGYNSTILAYGQTGSGKTYSMGIGIDYATEGIVPRFVHSLFQQLAQKQDLDSYQVSVSFLELHQEDLVDLLGGKGFQLTIREDTQGNICWTGVKEEVVTDPMELMELLKKGSIARTTASTDMNHTSSRSHAIFSVILRQIHQNKKLVSKFHFVDLAGSERLKRTNAVGDRAREGISINSGLLALGNVISALGDESRRVSHIPYRDSKLTRLLQDSLGGNSQTLMLACASPADSNRTETVNTLKYANRARNIRNRVVVNQEMGEVERLKETIHRLKEEARSNDLFSNACSNEMDALKTEVVSLTHTLEQTSLELAQVRCQRDHYRHQLTADNPDTLLSEPPLVAEYARTIEHLRVELLQTQEKLRLCTERDDETLVGSPCHSSNQCPEKTQAPKRQHRVNTSKRSKYIKKKPHSSITTTHLPQKLITLQKSATQKPSKLIQDTKRKLQREVDFLKGHPMTWLPENEKPKIKYRRRTLGSIHTDLEEEEYPMALLQRLAAMVQTQHDLLQELEQTSQSRDEQQSQHQQRMAELNSKKANLIARHKREMAEIKTTYEARLKKQGLEFQTLRRKHMQLMSKTDRMRHQNQSVIDNLNRTVEKLGHEKKKTIKRMKAEADRAREKCLAHERILAKAKKGEAQGVATKKRLEREIEAHKTAYRRLTEEVVSCMGQIKQMAAMVKQVVTTCPKLDMTNRTLLTKALACANVRGYPNPTTPKLNGKQNAASLQQGVVQKKKILSRAIEVFVQQQTKSTMIEEVLRKRDQLNQEQKELLSERKTMLVKVHRKETFTFEELSETQYMDERIDAITLELNRLEQELNLLQSGSEDWSETLDHIQDDPYETALSLVRTLESEEAKSISELLLEDLIQLKKLGQSNAVSLPSTQAMLQSLQDALVQARRVVASREMDPILMRVLKNSIQIQHGLLLPA